MLNEFRIIQNNILDAQKQATEARLKYEEKEKLKRRLIFYLIFSDRMLNSGKYKF